MPIEHVDIGAGEIHEPKGAASALAGQVYVADGAGSGTWTTTVPGTLIEGFYNYNDLATASTPIALTTPGTQYELTNDGAGTETNLTYALSGLANMWNTSTNRFEFNDGSVLSLGDTVDIRFDIEVTTSSANTAIEIAIELGTGGSAYQLPFFPESDFKTAGTYRIVKSLGIYMGDTNTLDNLGRVLAKADTAGATIKVNGWYIRALHTN